MAVVETEEKINLKFCSRFFVKGLAVQEYRSYKIFASYSLITDGNLFSFVSGEKQHHIKWQDVKCRDRLFGYQDF